MKKFLAMILTLAIVLSMSTMVFAEDFTNGTWGADDGEHDMADKSQSQVTVDVTPATDTYHVVITWESLEFTYSFGAWNPQTHAYEGGWIGDTSADITIENHSNADVWFDAELADAQNDGVTVEISLDAVTKLDSADSDDYRKNDGNGTYTHKGDSEIITVTVSDQPTDRNITSLNAGTVTVTVYSADPAASVQP